MLLNYKISGFKVFNKPIEISFAANKKIKNKDYVININKEEILKSAIIYGPNNTGKSCLIESLSAFKEIILAGKIIDNFKFAFDYNVFNERKVIDYSIEFFDKKKIDKYKYELSFEYEKGIIKEILNVNDSLIFNRNEKNSIQELNDVIELYKSYNDKLIISTLPKNYLKYTKAINEFFESINIISKVRFDDVVNEVSSLNKNDLKKFTNILKSADISIENVIISDAYNDNKLKLFSEYVMNNKKISLPSIISDSDGTHVFMLYMAKVIKMMKKGGILIVDEIDRSLHTLLTKNIISIFNDEQNNNMQLLATSHDLLLLDCLYLFRKDQVWFSYKDKDNVYLYSLDTFKSNVDNQIRNKTLESYLKGLFGALPHPNVEEYLFDK